MIKKTNQTTGLEALLASSQVIKLVTNQRNRNPIHAQAVKLMLELGADKTPVTLEKIAKTRAIKDAEYTFGSVDNFNTSNKVLMEAFAKADSRSRKVIMAIKGKGKGNINNSNLYWNVEKVNDTFKLVPK